MSYKGKFKPAFPEKYVGDPTNIIYRSLWELKFLKYCDTNVNILEYASEELAIPYRSPVDGRIHRYFPDAYIKVKEPDGSIKKYLIEIKPHCQTLPPVQKNRKTKSLIYQQAEYVKNQAKWTAAAAFAKNKGMVFTILTEKHLGL